MNAKFALLLFSCLGSLTAAEYFVSPAGKDSFAGTSEQQAFQTIRQGMKVLQSGDTLTILSGKYHEAIRKKLDGDPAKKTVIRAKYPGTVLIHGDLPLHGFRAFGKAGIYAVRCEKKPEAVTEQDTLTLYNEAQSDFLTALLPAAASWYYDPAEKMLYLRTSDGQSPEKHLLKKNVLGADGFHISPGKNKKVANVEIDGLIVRGFQKRDQVPGTSVWGIVLFSPVNCVIRRCTAAFNCGGISMHFADHCRIDECLALANGTTKQVSAGNIIVMSGKDSMIDRSFSYASRTYGIRFYGSNMRDTIRRSVSIGDKRGAIWIKPCDKISKLSEVYTPAEVACARTEHSLFRNNEYDPNGKMGPTSFFMGKKYNVHTAPEDFADVTAFDFRLTKDSKVKNGFVSGTFFYLAPEGNDRNDGKSKTSPKKTLRGLPQGATVYLLPGIYSHDLEITQSDLTLAGYGQSKPAVIGGTVKVSADRVTLKKLNFVNGTVNSSGKDLVIENCNFAKIRTAVRSSQPVMIRHSAFAADVENPVTASGSVICSSIMNRIPANCILFGNAYSQPVPKQDHAGIRLTAQFKNTAEGDFTLKNEPAFRGTSADGTMIGPCFLLYEPAKASYSNLKIYPAGARGASLQFETNQSMKDGFIRFRKKGGLWETAPNCTVDSCLHYVSMNDLEPDTEYQCEAVAAMKYGYQLGNHRIPGKADLKKKQLNFSGILTFKTPAKDRPPCIWHVSTLKGNDLNPGSLEKPFKTITKASQMTQPGDTVLVHEGTYKETISIPVSGTAEKPITYRGAPGETVWLNGNSRQLCRGFAAFGKENLRFDAFRTKRFGTALPNSSGICLFFRCRHIRISRILNDGRGSGYSPPILHVRYSEDVEMKNCLGINSMTGAVTLFSKGIVLENNVLKMASIWPVVVMSDQDHVFRFTRNIVTDNLRQKTAEPLLKVQKPGNLEEAENIYFCRYPRDLRVIVGSMDGKQWTLDEFYHLMGKDGRSRFADPKFPAMPKLLCWKNAGERAAELKKDIAFWRNVNDYENARMPGTGNQFHVWDFADFFAKPTLKTSDGKTIGLEPDQFKDMTDLSKGKEQWQTF